MAGTSKNHSGKPRVSFSTANQAGEWQASYVRSLKYLKTLDTDADTPD